MTKILTEEEIKEYIDSLGLEDIPNSDLYYHRLSGNYIKLQKDDDGNYIDDVLVFNEKQLKLKLR